MSSKINTRKYTDELRVEYPYMYAFDHLWVEHDARTISGSGRNEIALQIYEYWKTTTRRRRLDCCFTNFYFMYFKHEEDVLLLKMRFG